MLVGHTRHSKSVFFSLVKKSCFHFSEKDERHDEYIDSSPERNAAKREAYEIRVARLC